MILVDRHAFLGAQTANSISWHKLYNEDKNNTPSKSVNNKFLGDEYNNILKSLNTP